MKLITIYHQEKELPALLVNDGQSALPLTAVLGDEAPASVLDLILLQDDHLNDRLKLAQENPGEGQISLQDAQLLAPIPHPVRNVICLGLNYQDHATELKDSFGKQRQVPEAPVYFGKMATEIVGPGAILKRHEGITNAIDYEVELVAVIGKGGTNIPAEKAFEHIFGYTIMNDVTARDLQQRHTQWIRGKSLDTYTAMGPALVHRSLFNDPPELDLSCAVNGEIRQSSNTRQFIFNLSYVISDLSRGFTLKPGDLIATGTPAGVGMGFDPPRYLKAGDVVTCTIEGIGTLENRVEA
ncbi:fumarylacetoacetate hydrolase family protein [Anoxynatronum buryatiense]|uniref:2-keto-4-pentenoate hydratase/2-oxohepta-3-ene-1,7-dioic acid hydratase (Catechol pathway) n=1 Tax=Anoxynatronum buryatiense TaxID=489973 RepID=A0AA45WTD4_9CLOT|nr:fumarylacetoacetate hydrolase family protein [Anoxynatronum buryatiense]SMP41313.1 2-keto-4-pentenoate hydratase/2-oxohepta-3-ene-1,7-dioic acid hydratase (catechol pathway) [Anoxynatronum buryatiense]